LGRSVTAKKKKHICVCIYIYIVVGQTIRKHVGNGKKPGWGPAEIAGGPLRSPG